MKVHCYALELFCPSRATASSRCSNCTRTNCCYFCLWLFEMSIIVHSDNLTYHESCRQIARAALRIGDLDSAKSYLDLARGEKGTCNLDDRILQLQVASKSGFLSSSSPHPLCNCRLAYYLERPYQFSTLLSSAIQWPCTVYAHTT